MGGTICRARSWIDSYGGPDAGDGGPDAGSGARVSGRTYVLYAGVEQVGTAQGCDGDVRKTLSRSKRLGMVAQVVHLKAINVRLKGASQAPNVRL